MNLPDMSDRSLPPSLDGFVRKLGSVFPTSLFVASAVGTAAFVGRMMADPNRAGFKPVFPDSFDYIRIAKLGPTDLGEFWFGQRPVLYPALLWLTGVNTQRAIAIQTLLYCVAVLFLATTILRLCRSRIVGAAGSVATIGLLTLPKYSQWSINLLTESLSATTAVFMSAMWLRLAAWPSRKRAAGAAMSTCLWVLARDGNAAVGLATSVGVLAVAAAMRWWEQRSRRSVASPTAPTTSNPVGSARRFVVAVAIAVVGCSMYMLVAQRVSERGRYWVHNVVGLDVLPNPTLKAWFIEHGMPMSPALEGRTGRDAWSDGNASFLESPDLVEYRKWAASDGIALMQRSFVQNFSQHSKKLHNDWPVWRKSRGNDYDVYQTFSRWPEVPGQLRLTGHTMSAMAIIMLAAMIVIIGLARGHAARRVTSVLVVMIATSGLEIYLSFVADGVERYRHTIIGQMRLDMTIVLAVCCAADQLASRIRLRESLFPKRRATLPRTEQVAL
jgi:hypothetical protein